MNVINYATSKHFIINSKITTTSIQNSHISSEQALPFITEIQKMLYNMLLCGILDFVTPFLFTCRNDFKKFQR